MVAFAIHLIQTTIGSNEVAKQRNIHSRTRGKWEEQEHLVKRAPNGWKEKKKLEASYEKNNIENTESPVGTKKTEVKIGRAPPNFDIDSLN